MESCSYWMINNSSSRNKTIKFLWDWIVCKNTCFLMASRYSQKVVTSKQKLRLFSLILKISDIQDGFPTQFWGFVAPSNTGFLVQISNIRPSNIIHVFWMKITTVWEIYKLTRLEWDILYNFSIFPVVYVSSTDFHSSFQSVHAEKA